MDLMEEKKEDKPFMMDKGADEKKFSREMEGTMIDAVELADKKVPAMEEMVKNSRQEHEGTMTDAVEFPTKKTPYVKEGTMAEAA
eukprot:12134941-Ditylum_brightwellii.AAC.1